MPKTLLCASVLLLNLAAYAGELSGHVTVTGRNHPGASTIVYAEPLDAPAPDRPVRAMMAQKNKTLVPHLVVVPVNSTIDFPNRDDIFHNIFSDSRPHPFDLGLYRAGASKSQTFHEAGSYRVFCNIHPQMAAVILVLPTSYFVEANSGGDYRMELPDGRYRVTAWSERSRPTSSEVTVQGSASTNLTLDESQFVELAHKNKYGLEYPKQSYDPLANERPQ